MKKIIGVVLLSAVVSFPAVASAHGTLPAMPLVSTHISARDTSPWRFGRFPHVYRLQPVAVRHVELRLASLSELRHKVLADTSINSSQKNQLFNLIDRHVTGLQEKAAQIRATTNTAQQNRIVEQMHIEHRIYSILIPRITYYIATFHEQNHLDELAAHLGSNNSHVIEARSHANQAVALLGGIDETDFRTSHIVTFAQIKAQIQQAKMHMLLARAQH